MCFGEERVTGPGESLDCGGLETWLGNVHVRLEEPHHLQQVLSWCSTLKSKNDKDGNYSKKIMTMEKEKLFRRSVR